MDNLLLDQVLQGIRVELEHSKIIGDHNPQTLTPDDVRGALDIALDHLAEVPDYYTRLKEVESDKKASTLLRGLSSTLLS